MRLSSLLSLGFLALALALSAARPASADFAYAIGDGGSSLLRFDTVNPGAATRVGFFQAGLFLDAIDFRPGTGQLYGYSDLADAYYTVNLSTGALTMVGAAGSGTRTNTFNLGMDFNPTVDMLRVVTDSTQNIVFNPNTGATTAATPLAYASGDTAAGVVPLIIDNAYTNNRAGATTSQQYALDYGENTLVTLANNTGVLNTVGKIRLNGTELDFTEIAGFDISTSAAGVNTAYALLKVGGISSLYTIDLASGNATSLGAFDSRFSSPSTNVYGLAVQGTGVVPEPASLAMVVLGLGGISLAIRHRRRAHRAA